MKLLFLIVARAGSKGVPGKNLRQIAGLSLLGFKALAARRSPHCTRLIISTDSPEIQAEALRYGVEVPFTRPHELATDNATTAAVVAHTLKELEGCGERYDAVMILEPSSPFARTADLDTAVELMIAKQATLVIGVRRVNVSSVFVGPLGPEGQVSAIVSKALALNRMRRQDQEPEYTANGALYLVDVESFRRTGTIYADPATSYGLVMPAEYSVEIDEPRDLAYAEFLVERGHIDLREWLDQVDSS